MLSVYNCQGPIRAVCAVKQSLVLYDQAGVLLVNLLDMMQTFELWRSNGSLAKLERDACLSYYKFQAPDQVQHFPMRP